MVAMRVVTLVQKDIESTLTVSPVEYNNKLTLSSDSGPQGLVSRVARTTYKVTDIVPLMYRKRLYRPISDYKRKSDGPYSTRK